MNAKMPAESKNHKVGDKMQCQCGHIEAGSLCLSGNGLEGRICMRCTVSGSSTSLSSAGFPSSLALLISLVQSTTLIPHQDPSLCQRWGRTGRRTTQERKVGAVTPSSNAAPRPTKSGGLYLLAVLPCPTLSFSVASRPSL